MKNTPCVKDPVYKLTPSNECMMQTFPTVYANRLLDAMKPQIWAHVARYNAQFDGQHSKAYPLRLKKTEINTLFNILRAYCAQLAAAVNAGDPIRNVVLINNVSAQAGDGHKSNTPRHLSKLCRAGFLAGFSSEGQQYRSVLEGGKGFGYCPIKRFRGTGRDFGLLLNPRFVPLGALPLGVPVLFQDGFARPQGMGHSPKCETFDLPLDKKNFINESMKVEGDPLPQKVFASAHGLSEEKERQAQEDRKGAGGAAVDVTSPDLPMPAGIPRSGEAITEDAPKGSLFRKLYLEGEEIEAYAILLVQMYLNKLAPAMKQASGEGRVYYPSSVARGVSHAEDLLRRYKDPKEGFDQLTAVIDRMQARILRDPYRSYVAPPCKWFDGSYPYNIHFHRERYLKPYLARKEDFRTGKAFQEEMPMDDIQIAEESRFHGLAWSMKKYMCELYPKDKRLRAADLNKWAGTLRLMSRRDHVPYDHMVHVAKWMLLSEDTDARFWREAGGFGIRSATGFRRNYQQMQDQYSQGVARERRKAS